MPRPRQQHNRGAEGARLRWPRLGLRHQDHLREQGRRHDRPPLGLANNNDSFTQVATDLATPKQGTANCLISALGFVDGALFVACKGLSSGALVNAGHLVNKATGPTSTGASLSSLPLFAQTITEDAECDPVTFAAQNRDALWAKNRNTNVLNAFQLPGFTCGRSIGPLVAAPTQQNPNPDPVLTLVSSRRSRARERVRPGLGAILTPRSDQDGLLDCWEQPWPGDLTPRSTSTETERGTSTSA